MLGGSATGYTALQKVDYKYNIRGWLEAINDIDGLMSTDLGNKDDLFAFKISYNTPEDTNKALFNGNISETYWRTLYDDQKRKYEYTYDHLNRLLQADYSRPNTNIRNAYKEALTYDKNGNITTLVRNSFEDESYEYEIDNLVYAYDANNKNQLAKVTDNSGWTDGFNENKDPNGYSANDTTDYTYDANGNMTSDENKGITSITYNHLNLPVKIVFDNDSNFRIEYLYDATGKKVAKKFYAKETVHFPCQGGGGGDESFRGTSAASVTQQCSSTNQRVEETDYLAGGFQYKFGQLEFFPHAEGFVKWDGSYAQYYFNYTDHLGNVRLTYYDKGEGPIILEESHYYPFGLKHKGYNEPEQYERYWGNGVVTNQSVNSNKYKYNGKELQDELGLNMYDYGARNYDPALGRWMNIDPLAETFYHLSGYNYVNNNPINSTDPNGMWTVSLISNTNSNGDVVYSLQFTAEEGDNIETLSKQLGISVDVLNKLTELNGANINTGSSFGLSELSEVKQINRGINQMLSAENLSNCANLAANCNDVGLSYQYGNTGEENVDKLAKYIQVMYESVEQKDSKIGTIIHYRLTAKAESQVRTQVIEMMVQRLKASGKTDVEIKVLLSKPEFKSDIDNATKTILVNERHYAVVVLKSIGGDKVQNIIQKTGTIPMERKVLPANVNEGANYIPAPIENTTNPYYNKK